MSRLFGLFTVITLCCYAEAADQYGPEVPGIQETATVIGVQSQLNLLRHLSHDSNTALQRLRLHQRVIERVLAASLEVDATVAQIDNEIGRANEIRGYLTIAVTGQ